MSAHEYSVQFRISGDIVPDQVTAHLGLQPNHIRIAGSVVHGRKLEQSLWSFSGAPEGIFVDPSETLEEGLRHLLEKLAPKKELLQSYIDNNDAIWWCGHFQSSFDGGPTLSPALLVSLAAFGVPLYIDNYFCEE